MSIKVVHVGTGFVGKSGLRAVIDHPDQELVALVVHSEEKVGLDAGEFVGLGATTGIKATRSLDEALATKPDVVAYFNTTHGRLKDTINEFCTILASGANIVTTSVGSLISPKSVRPDVLAKLEDACKEGSTTLFSTGIDPGVFSDFLPVALTGCVRRVDGIRIYEMAVYESGQQSDSVAFEQVGFGMPIDSVPPLVHPDGLKASWGGVLMMMAEELGLEGGEVVSSYELLPAPEDFPYQGRIIKKGTICGMQFEIAYVKDGNKPISVHHVTRARHDLAPDWPRPLRGDAYRIVIEGEPRLDCEFEFSSETGEHLIGGFGITAMRAVNAIESVVSSEPGVKSVFDLPLITAKGRINL